MIFKVFRDELMKTFFYVSPVTYIIQLTEKLKLCNAAHLTFVINVMPKTDHSML